MALGAFPIEKRMRLKVWMLIFEVELYSPEGQANIKRGFVVDMTGEWVATSFARGKMTEEEYKYACEWMLKADETVVAMMTEGDVSGLFNDVR